MAPAHALGDKVEAAYRRGDLFQKRRQLMDAWARHCADVAAGAVVVPIGGTRLPPTVAAMANRLPPRRRMASPSML